MTSRLAHATFALLFAIGIIFSTHSVRAEPLRLAVTDVEGLERLQTEWGPFKAALEKATGLEFKFLPVNNRTAAAEALRAKKVDFVISGPAEYVVIHKLTDARALIGFSRPDYFCAIVAMSKSPILKPADLKGKKVSFKDVGSTSGHLCPMQVLADYGIDPMKDIKRVHTSLNVQHEALKRGDTAAMGVNYNSWIARTRDKDGSVPPGAFRVIARSGDLPNDMLMVASHVDAAVAKKVADAIVDNEKAIADAILAHEENGKYKGMTFLKISDQDYDGVRDMYATIGHPQYSNFVGD